jgi:hypothetical protein
MNGADGSKRYPLIVEAAARINGTAILDAEVVWLGLDGESLPCLGRPFGGDACALWNGARSGHIQNLLNTSFHSHVEMVAPMSPSFKRTADHTKAELKFAS